MSPLLGRHRRPSPSRRRSAPPLSLPLCLRRRTWLGEARAADGGGRVSLVLDASSYGARPGRRRWSKAAGRRAAVQGGRVVAMWRALDGGCCTLLPEIAHGDCARSGPGRAYEGRYVDPKVLEWWSAAVGVALIMTRS
jgi:hypothetical protein